MKPTTGYKRGLAEIRSLMTRRKYSEALSEVEARLGDWPDQPALLVLKGELIQLQDENGPPLDDAAAALKRAVSLDDLNPNAWLELGHFQFAIEDDAKAAEKSFAEAIAAGREALISALVGRAGALEEMGRKHEAFDCLSVARSLQGNAAAKIGSESDATSLFERWESLVGNA